MASEQGLDTSVCKRVFKPQRLKSQIEVILFTESVSLPAANQDLDILLTVEGLPSVYSMVTLSPSSSNIASKCLDISTS